MKRGFSANTWLAFFFLAASVQIVFLWIPLDTGTGLIETVRRRSIIGDALGPTVAGTVVAVGAGLLMLRSGDDKALTRSNILWLLGLLCLFVVSLGAMRYAGPIAASWIDGGYRPLRATPPWNYLGFLLGGTVMVGGLTALANRQATVRDFAIGFVASLLIALLYDLPFEDLILPPNGDV